MVQTISKFKLRSAHEMHRGERASEAIRDALAILDAIEQGGLLDALPELENDRRRHQTASTLLSLLKQRLLESIGDHETAVQGEGRNYASND